MQPSAVIAPCDGSRQRDAISVPVPAQALGSLNRPYTPPACEPAAVLGAHGD